MEGRWLALLSLLLVPFWASPAGADTVTIKYEVTSGFVNTFEASFPVTSGTFSTTYTSSGSAPIDGPAVLDTLAFAADGFTFSGSFRDSLALALKSPADGTGTSNTGFVNVVRVDLIGDIDVHCYVSTYYGYNYCPQYGLQASVSENFGMSGFGNAGDLAVRKVAMDEVDLSLGSVNFTVPGFTAGTGSVSLRGREIERVPEAGRGLMLLSALLTTVMLAQIRRSRAG